MVERRTFLVLVVVVVVVVVVVDRVIFVVLLRRDLLDGLSRLVPLCTTLLVALLLARDVPLSAALRFRYAYFTKIADLQNRSFTK